MQKVFDFSLEPGKKLNKVNYEKKEPVISVIIPFYYDKDYIEQSVNCVLNQTYPYFELLIIDDGTKDEEHLKKLSEIEKLDERIKVFHKENEGLAATRDYGAKQACKSSKYLMFLDSDDLIEPTFLECSYWTLETNKDASWAYADTIGFDSMQYTWNKWLDSDKLKKDNVLVSACIIRKEAFEDVGGYGLREKAVNEDWNFWLKLLAKKRYPVHMSFYGLWYRRKENGELKKSIDNRKRSLEIINKTAETIKEKVEAIQYPRSNYDYELIPENVDSICIPKQENDGKINILMIIPWMVVGGADKYNLDLIRGLDKNKYSVTLITTEPNKNVLRQEFEKDCTVYDLTTFLDKEYWLSFINYIIEKNNVNIIFNTNSKYGYSILPYLKQKHQIPVLDYIHMEEWYHRNGGFARYSGNLTSVIDKTLTCNGNTSKILNSHFNIPKEKIETVYIGVDAEKYNPEKYDKNEFLAEYGINAEGKNIISYICRITEQKRPFLLLEIIKKLKEKRQDILFVIAGNGNLLAAMQRRAKELELDKYIKFLDHISETEKVYKISDVTINCSLKEGVALTSYESLSMGVPVVSSDVGGQKELINDEVGVIVPCKQKENDIYMTQYKDEEISSYVDAIDKILNDLDKYKNNCRKRILEKFTIKNMVDKMCEIFEDLVENNKNHSETNIKETGVAKELITMNIICDKEEYGWQCKQYEIMMYGNVYSDQQVNYKYELLKEKLWTIPLWRGLIKIYHKIK